MMRPRLGWPRLKTMNWLALAATFVSALFLYSASQPIPGALQIIGEGKADQEIRAFERRRQLQVYVGFALLVISVAAQGIVLYRDHRPRGAEEVRDVGGGGEVSAVAGSQEAEGLALVEAHARAYANGLREARPMAEASQQHQDQMLTWAIGLMGGGLFYLPNLLAQICSIDSRPRFVLIAGPWTLGILLALVGRMVSAHHRHVDSLAFFGKWQAIEGTLLRGLRRQELAKAVLRIMRDEEPSIKAAVENTRRLGWWCDLFYYSAHAAFALGIICIGLALALCVAQIPLAL